MIVHPPTCIGVVRVCVSSCHHCENACFVIFVHLDREEAEQATQFLSSETKHAISSIRFGHNCVVFLKKTADEYDYQNRRYRFSGSL
jgi:hypothetical protein